LPLLARRNPLQALLEGVGPGVRFTEHMEGGDSEAMFQHACRIGELKALCRRS
jgi:hypothetical protein